MLASLGIIFLIGLCMADMTRRMHLPRVVGMLFCGMIIGPFVLNWLDPTILGISSELRQMALVIILMKAGLSLKPEDMKKVGRPALLLSFLPAVFEIIGCTLLAPVFFPVSYTEAAILGAVLGAVSPAVVVPRMVQLIDEHYGTEKKIPQLILAGASLDDVFVIVLFTVFVGLCQSGSIQLSAFSRIPVSIITGIAGGIAAGMLLAAFFDTMHHRGNTIRSTMKLIILLGTSFLLKAAETMLEPYFAFSGLLAVMSMGCALAARSSLSVVTSLKDKTGKLWLAAEVILFVLVGAAVDIRYTMTAGVSAVLLILICLVFRSFGVVISLLGTPLNRMERLYCILAYLPKATVQAAIGGVPLALGLPCGNLVLSVAVLSILLTAPLGAFCMDLSYQKLLQKEGPLS